MTEKKYPLKTVLIFILLIHAYKLNIKQLFNFDKAYDITLFHKIIYKN